MQIVMRVLFHSLSKPNDSDKSVAVITGTQVKLNVKAQAMFSVYLHVLILIFVDKHTCILQVG